VVQGLVLLLNLYAYNNSRLLIIIDALYCINASDICSRGAEASDELLVLQTGAWNERESFSYQNRL
jgi:hypothetical protein